MDKIPDLALIYDEQIPTTTFEEFDALIEKTGFSYAKESREYGPVACIEWFIPTAAIFFVGKAYFESFFKEMGKDHYHLVKKGLQSLRKAFLSKTKTIQYTHVAVPSSKISQDPVFSRIFSIMAKSKNGESIKFLFPNCISEEKFEKSIDAYFLLLAQNYSSEQDDNLTTQIKSLKGRQHTILVRYNQENQKVEVIDPIAEIQKEN